MRGHAILLDVTHRLRVIDGGPLVVEAVSGMRVLEALAAAARERLGYELPLALGYRVMGDEAWFVFVDGEIDDDEMDGELVPLRRWAAAHATAWRVYVDAMLAGWQPPTTELEVFGFGNEPRLASQLAHHVIKGSKRATTSWNAATTHDGWTPPHPGLVSIVTDGFGIPLCAIETTRVDRARFADATAEIAAAEGEADHSMADWRAAHLAYFAAESARIGIPFTEDAEMSYEYFRVVRVFWRAS
jgi:uncharacterized protein YhfF